METLTHRRRWGGESVEEKAASRGVERSGKRQSESETCSTSARAPTRATSLGRAHKRTSQKRGWRGASQKRCHRRWRAALQSAGAHTRICSASSKVCETMSSKRRAQVGFPAQRRRADVLAFALPATRTRQRHD
eukprot:6212608-Pleurochrysis_carterae.AAC.2